ncbi:MAG: methenyltetrahydromethanopterin cyclohydrolase [Pirellulaceae bacterium]|nr:methenyltetrahydromethanopterin cyclohydrolase [Pirellulaceae bacterium]
MRLNEQATRVVQEVIARADRLRVAVSAPPQACCVIDCGVAVPGGLAAGCYLAEACLAGLGHVQVGPGPDGIWSGPWVTVQTDHPLAACMAAQYAGWPLSYGKYFAMGSGPMRAARGKEPLFERIGCLEQATRAVGILESSGLPPDEVQRDIARQCGVEPENVTLLVAPTASLAGTVQIVARSIETALHKLYELGFDLTRVVAGWGRAPLPPVAADFLTGIGRTNDAILYGARVTLWVRGDDASLCELGPRVPSRASSDFGRPFAEIFDHYERDFYRIDPLLFSPAEVHLVNLDTGRTHRHGQPEAAILATSFLGQ